MIRDTYEFRIEETEEKITINLGDKFITFKRGVGTTNKHLAYALERLTNFYTGSQDVHLDTLNTLNDFLDTKE